MLHRLRSFAAACSALLVCGTLLAPAARADVKLPHIFTSHLVLQRDQANPVWGTASPDEKVTVSIAGQKHSATAGADGTWRVRLEPLSAGGPHRLVIQGNNTIELEDILVGEVWICSGQSNMQWSLKQSVDGDLAALTAGNYPQLRLISVPQVGTQEPQDDFNGQWEVCSPTTTPEFSAVGYYFGRQLQETLKVPVGLIDDAWGGSACEAWIPRKTLESDPKYAALMEQWKNTEATFDFEKEKAAYQKRLEKWKVDSAEARKAGKPVPQAPRGPNNVLTGNSRPGNIYNGVLRPTVGYGIRGAIWYQGESNAGRAYQYRDLFPLMISTWRDLWGQGEFSFYWVQLADFQAEKTEPGDSAWAELREAQTMTMSKLKNTGEAVIIDLGEGRDIHPRKKLEVGLRLARWALAKDYGIKVPYHSPQYKSVEFKDDKALLTFDHVGGTGLYTFDVNEPIGFTIAGDDKMFVTANARILGPDKIEVWSDKVKQPTSVRYAWADNPICNVTSKEDLPLTPFRTDDWPGVTVGK